jgi:transcription-repair coupling factor (superfamily II helicase)
VPRPMPSGFGAQPPRDEELLAWVRQVIDGVIQPERGGQSGAGGKAGSEETGS